MPTDAILQRIVALYEKVYAQAKYTVDPAVKTGETSYTVKVTVAPIDLFQLVEAEFDSYVADFRAKYAKVDTDAMTEAEYAAYDAEWAGLVLDLCEKKLPELGHLDAQSTMVHVARGADGYWDISDEDFQNIDWLIIDYNF